MKREEWFREKWLYLKRFAVLAAVGVLFLIASAYTEVRWLAVLGALALVPLMLSLVLIPLFHWKDRYKGERSGLWGAVLLIETTGWFKIVYWLRHVLPDWKRNGRYQNAD